MATIPGVFSWQIRLHQPDKFDNPDWHGIQTVLAREFSDAIWNRISGSVFDHVEMALIPLIKLPHTADLFMQISSIARSLAPEAKSPMYPKFSKIFTESYWPKIRMHLEEVIGGGAPGGVVLVSPGMRPFAVEFVAPGHLFPREWEIPTICLKIRDVVPKGIIPIIVSLEPQLGSPMN